MNRTAFKFAASSVILAMTMAGFSTQGAAMRRLGNTVQANGPTDRQAAQLHERAARALREGRLAEALTQMEEAVALSPRDIGYRLLLGDIYLKGGRFESARATFGDALTLDPGNVRAGLNSALTLIALGRPQSAGRQLDALASTAPPSDIGLAYALAGRTDRAIELLETASRRATATPRIRQNLALAYAIAGDWRRARAIAAQDLPADEVGQRLQQWAAFARPDSGPAQVAGLLGVSPSQDPGQPTRLALAPAADDTALAFAEATVPVVQPEAVPAPAPIYQEIAYASTPPAPVAEPAPAPVQVAEAAPAEAPAFWVPTAQAYDTQPEPAPVEDAPAPAPTPVAARYAIAARSLVEPLAPLIRAEAGSPRTPPPPFRRANAADVARGNQPVVVQIGAFSVEANAERAWVKAERDYGLDEYRPLTTTFSHEGRTFHRVSISGFASTADAQRLCGSIRGQGGVCFVRLPAGDAAIRWAARYPDPRRRNV